jgi:hypothetical protein
LEKNRTGEIVLFAIDGRIAEKVDGKITGKWINFKKGDVGKIINARSLGKWSKDIVFTVGVAGGVIKLRGSSLDFPRNSDIKILYDAMMIADPSNRVSKTDIDAGKGAEY